MSIRRLAISVGSFFSILAVFANLFFLNGCGNNQANNAETIEGEMLVKKYCTSCHVSAGPELLDRETWETNVLPAMGKKLGISTWSGQYFQESLHAGVSIDDWQKIVSYFLKNSPEKLDASTFKHPLKHSADFLIVKPTLFDTAQIASTTMVKYNLLNKMIYTSDVLSKNLYVWDKNLNLVTKASFQSPVVDIFFDKKSGSGQSEEFITVIGSINPDDSPRGKLLKVSNGKYQNVSTVGELFPRPVNSLTADFNEDGLPDIVVCGFGNTIGGLYLLRQVEEGKYQKSEISPRAGALKAEIGDYNKDGWPDIMCLFAQGDEGIWMYLNDQKGGFRGQNLLRFPPVYGSSSFQVVDFDKDGFDDILYTSGDNSDYSRILKPYHGIYIFTNNGRNKFEPTYFYPVNGCTKAVATDLNQDGRLDLVSIAFFSDTKNNPGESFMYLLQDENARFRTYSLPVDNLGKWLCMDVQDMDEDGYPDIILGNFSIEGFNQPGAASTWDRMLPFIVLKNQLNKGLN